MAKLETIRVQNPDDPGGSIIINKSKYDENPERYKIAKEPVKASTKDDTKDDKSAASKK